jgi:hypothetical protein
MEFDFLTILNRGKMNIYIYTYTYIYIFIYLIYILVWWRVLDTQSPPLLQARQREIAQAEEKRRMQEEVSLLRSGKIMATKP